MPRVAIIDDTHPGLTYTGEWRTETTLSHRSPEYNGTIHATNDPNATITFDFYGTVLNVFGSINQPATLGYPNASFTIQPNAVLLKHFNQSGTVPMIPIENLNGATSHVEMFKSGKFAEGNYTMTIKADGASPNGPTYYFDFLTVLTPDSVYVEDVIVDDGTQWNYNGGWNDVNVTGNYLESLHTTPENGGNAILGFRGTEIAVYGSLKGPFNASLPLGTFQIGDRPAQTVFAGNVSSELLLRNSTLLQNQVIFHATGLPDIGQKQYTLTISVPAPPPTPTSTSRSGSATTSSASSTITGVPTNPPWQLDCVIHGPSYAILALPTSTDTSQDSSAPPVGAITGGVIGGLAGFVLLILAFLFWHRRHRQKLVAANAVQKGFETAYSMSAATSRPTLAGRRTSIHKGGGKVVDTQVLDIGIGSQFGSNSGRVGTSTLTGPETADTVYQTDFYPGRGPAPRPVREMDGGVRLASGSNFDSEAVEVLPPSYAQYHA